MFHVKRRVLLFPAKQVSRGPIFVVGAIIDRPQKERLEILHRFAVQNDKHGK